MNEATQPSRPAPRRPAQGKVVEVTDAVRLAIGYHLGSVIQVVTPEGAVIIDSTGGTANAAAARDGLRERVPAETRYLVYTHCHSDHCGGAEPLISDGTEAVVAQDLLPDLWERDFGCLSQWTDRIRSWQRGIPIEASDLAEEAGASYFYGDEHQRSYIEPTLTFKDSLDLEVGGLTFHLEHTQGETRDHLLVWIPELRVLCPGDLYYAAFPNLSSPAIGPRPIQGWIRSLDRFLELGAEHLVPSHTRAISGPEQVREVLTNYRDAIAFVWDESVRSLNEGLSVDEAAARVRLPENLAALPYLAEMYGTVSWGVRAVYDQLTGWYDGDPAHLDPLPRTLRDREVVALAGADAMVGRAETLHAHGEHQLALELISLVISGQPDHSGANRLQIAVCRSLVEKATSINQIGFYRSGIRIAEARLASLG